MTKGSDMFKIGRSTGHTVGQLHDIDASVTINYNIDGPDGKQSFLLKGKALVIRGTAHKIFASCGDSGALVLNGHAEAVGMVTADADLSVTDGVAYVSPFTSILDSIKDILGCQSTMVKVEVL